MESTLLESFHFIRPLWLLMLIPLVALLLLGQQRRKQQRQWHQVIDPQLIDHMVEQAPSDQHMPQLRWLAIGGLLAIFAAAGPSWQKLPQPVYKNDDSLVVLLDMSYSMAAEDVKPSRAERAIQKVHDILNTRRDGLTALVTYAGDAHTVTPLTDDNATIANLLPALSPFIMPKAGSRPDLAIQLAQHLVRDAGQKGAQLLLITDGIQDRDIGRIESALDAPDFQLGIITLGSQEGAPIPLPKGGFLQDGNGAMVLPGLNTGPFSQLQQQTGIQWQPISLLDNDWQSLIRQQPVNAEAADSDSIQRQYDSWIDEGYWLLLPLLPLALLVFRKGTFAVCVMAAVLLSSAIPAQPAYAEEAGQAARVATAPAESSVWDNLWSTPDQQGSQLMDTDPAAAAQRFEDSSWAGSAAYKAGDYQAAADAFAKALEQNPTAEGYYNQANALAQQGKLQQALDAYDQALAQSPHMEDAIGNRKIVEQALKQQQQNQNQSQDSSDNSSQDSSQGDQQNQQDQGQQQNSQGQQGSNKQDQGQQQSQSGQQGQQQGQPSDQANDQQGQSGNSDTSEQQNDKDFQQRLQQQQNQQAQQNQQSPSDAEAGQQQSTEQRQAQQEGQDQGQQDQTQAAQTAEHGEQGDDQAPQNVQPLGDIPADSLKNLSPEQQANLRQWLNRVPDQPGKLLQRKFLYQYSQQQQQENDPEEVLW